MICNITEFYVVNNILYKDLTNQNDILNHWNGLPGRQHVGAKYV